MRDGDIHSPAQVAASRIVLTGHVQGVGFRPFVYRIAQELGLNGWVQNQLGQVGVHVEGPPEAVRLASPARSSIAHHRCRRRRFARCQAVAAENFPDFTILVSSEQSEARIFVPPDYFTCKDCLD